VGRVDVNCLRQGLAGVSGRFGPWIGGCLMRSVLDVVLLALQIYVWILVASAVLSWLIAFNVVNTRNQFVSTVWDFLYRITEPALRPIRDRMPNLGGIDISPIILLLLIFFIQSVIVRYIYPNVF
jgi:YggT family protein